MAPGLAAAAHGTASAVDTKQAIRDVWVVGKGTHMGRRTTVVRC